MQTPFEKSGAAEADGTTLAARAVAYGCLSKILLPPDEPTAEAMRSGRLIAELEAAAGALGSLSADRIRRLSASSVGGADPEERYYRTFDHALVAECPPFETEYGAAGNFLRTNDLSDVAGYYDAWGVALGDVHERPDHVGIEADFMNLLALREGLALERGDREHADLCARTSRRFLEQHLGGFAPLYAERFESVAADPLYVEAMALLAELVRDDLAARGGQAEPRHRRLPVLLGDAEDGPVEEQPDKPAPGAGSGEGGG